MQLIEWGEANGIDWLIGRKLPGMVSTNFVVRFAMKRHRLSEARR